MAPITLLNRGSLIARMGEDQDELDNLVPINHIMNWIGARVTTKSASTMSDRVLILLSKTGSGKSSSVAPTIYLRFFNKYRKRIVITQPRVLTAVEIPKDIAKIEAYKTPNREGLSIELYRNLGYQTQEFVRKTRERGILFCTTGILLQYLKTMPDEQFCRKFKFVIIDEAHDRSLDVDLILLMMKRLIHRNLSKDPPFLILMSATLDVDQYRKYFNTKTVFEVSGQSKPIETIYPSVEVSDIYAKTCEIVKNLTEFERKNPSADLKKGVRDAIVFMPSTAPIKRMIAALEVLNKELPQKILPISITAADVNSGSANYGLLMEDPEKLFVNIRGKRVKAFRRVIVSTNVAETGLTLEMLRYCIDTGLQFSSEFNHRHGTSVLMTKPTTSSMSLQRKGRVGRKFAGTFYPLFTEEIFSKMVIMNTPSVSVEDITSHLLAIVATESRTIFKNLAIYQMMTPPSDDSVNYSFQKLFTLGAVDAHGTITPLGVTMNKFRKIGVESAKMILSGIVFGAPIYELVAIVCLMAVKRTDIILAKPDDGITPFTTTKILDDLYEPVPTYDRSKCDTMSFNALKAKLLVGCEMLELLLIYERFAAKSSKLSINDLMKWCESKGLNFHGLCGVTESIDEIYWLMIEQMRINAAKKDSMYVADTLYNALRRSTNADDTEFVDAIFRLKRCIYEGYRNNLLVWDDSKNSYISPTGLEVIVPSKLVNRLSFQKLGAPFEQHHPREIIYKDLLTRQDRSGNFVHEASLISVMDGYVHTDMEFSIL